MKDKKTNRVNVSVDSNGGSHIDNIIISDNKVFFSIINIVNKIC